MKIYPYSIVKHHFLNCKYQLLLICCVVLYLFYPSVGAEISLLDDREMINNLSVVRNFDLIATFFPHSHGGLYYRPMIYITFLIDRFLWNLDPSIMHLENILLHLASTLLVFLIARLIILKTGKIPLFAALLFAVHPIATESVNWISGRTDLLAVMFVLASLYSILCFRDSKRLWWLAVSIMSLLTGILAKETAIGFIPSLVFILASKQECDSSIADKLPVQRQPLIVFLSVCTLSVGVALMLFNYYLSIAIVLLYFFYLIWCRRQHVKGASMRKYAKLFSGSIIFLCAACWGIRKIAFTSQSPQIQRTFGLIFADFNYTLALFFRGAGFYAKKFIDPFPLCFVIREVSPFYTLLGIVLLCLVAALMIRRSLPDSLVIAGFWMIAPVLPLTFESVAWTSYAERYVYPAAPFWILALAGYASSAGFDQGAVRFRRWCLAGLSLLIVSMAALTFQRNLVWHTNLALFKDSVEKTPAYKPVRGLYITALFDKGLYGEALQQYQIAQSLHTIQLKYNPNYDLFYVQLLIAKNELLKAEAELDSINNKTLGKEPEVFEKYIELAPMMLLKTADTAEKKRITDKMAVSYDKWYELTNDPMLLYRKGQFLLSLDKKREAGKLFARAATTFPENNVYRGYAGKLSKKLAESL